MERKIPTWDEYFLGLSFLISQRSKDSQTQHGCVIVDNNKHIIGCGYNSFPKGMNDKTLPVERPDKYDWMIHSEVNAVSNCSIKPYRCTAYVTGEPCNNCLMHMHQNDIAKVVYADRHGSVLINEKTRAVRERFLQDSKIQLVAVEEWEGYLLWISKFLHVNNLSINN